MTKELVVDFYRSKQSSISPVYIQGNEIENFQSYEYPVVHPNNKLDWTDNIAALNKKGQNRLLSTEDIKVIWCAGSTSEVRL